MRAIGILSMIFVALVVSVCCHVSSAQTESMTMAGNYAADLYGTEDTRPDCYGYADSKILDIKFKPPQGHRVRILRARGDMVSWIMTKGRDIPVGSNAGVLLGLQSTASSKTNENCTFCAGGVMLYIQDSVSDRVDHSRSQFDYSDINMLLEPDNVFQVKMASWLNTTGFPIHVEASYTVTYRWEPVEK